MCGFAGKNVTQYRYCFEVSLSQMLNDILWPDHIQWQPPTDQTSVPNSTFYRILSGFHRTFATGVACRQGTLTPLDTWSRPFCSNVIEYSRNLIWPRSIFFILSVWCLFSYGVLINSNNVWIWGIIQISKIFARLWQFSFLFYMCYNFFTNDERSWVRITYVVISQCVEILFFARSLRCLKIYSVNT